ncbi:MAG TPA: hypothetical protein VFB03_03365 [Candidatus Saccharimonadales bacterium]|nr:hypothetical protein [Candidatus Saccharimonadales bacterium]
MSGQSQALGATTTVAGVAVLPNTGGNTLITVLATLTIVAGVAVLASSTISRLIARSRR